MRTAFAHVRRPARAALSVLTTAALTAFASAYAQDKPAPPPIWQQGKPPSMDSSKLARTRAR